MSTTLPTPSTELERGPLSTLEAAERPLWVLVAVFLVLDVAVTHYGLERGFVEANPVAQAAMAAVGTLTAMVLLKGFSLAVALVARSALPRLYRGIVPVALAVPWGVANVMNVALVF